MREIEMRQKNFFIFVMLAGIFLLIASCAVVKGGDFTSQPLHELLGDVIDAQENLRYNIFGDIPGFTAARIYRVHANKYRLHLLRNSAGRGQILVLYLPIESFSRLQKNVASRIDSARGQDRAFAPALYPIEESKWSEKSAHKKLILHDGSQIFVSLERAVNDTMLVQTLGGIEISVPDVNIAEIADLRGEMYKGEFFHQDPNISRLFFAPTGRALKAGTAYFADYFIFFPTFAYGVTDFFSIGGGFSLLPGASSQLVYFAPKFTLQTSQTVGFSAGLTYLNIPGDDNDLRLGYAVTTIGSKRSAVTFGAGLPLGSDLDENSILLISGEKQLSNSAKLISENWIFTGDAPTVFSAGVRFFGEKLAVDLALITAKEAFEGEGFPFLPYVDFSVFMGK
jgi:hypothetical protein